MAASQNKKICNQQPIDCSAKILVVNIFDEMKLITFILPNDPITVQDVLMDIGSLFEDRTFFQSFENPGANIDFVIMFGFTVRKAVFEISSRNGRVLKMIRNLEVNSTGALTNNLDDFGNATFGNMSEKINEYFYRFLRYLIKFNQSEPLPTKKTSKMNKTTKTLRTKRQSSIATYVIQKERVLKNRSNRNGTNVLIKLASGEEIQINYPLMPEKCTLRNVLDAAGLEFDSNTIIQCMKNSGAKIDFVAMVGFSIQNVTFDLIPLARQCPQ